MWSLLATTGRKKQPWACRDCFSIAVATITMKRALAPAASRRPQESSQSAVAHVEIKD
jgi:hypothetical protein